MYIEGVPSSVYQLTISHLLVIIVIAITSLLEKKIIVHMKQISLKQISLAIIKMNISI